MSSKTDKSSCSSCISKCQESGFLIQNITLQKDSAHIQSASRLESTLVKDVQQKNKKYVGPEYTVKNEKGRRNSAHDITKTLEKGRRHSAHGCCCKLNNENVRDQRSLTTSASKDASKATQQLATAPDSYNTNSSLTPCIETIYSRIINSKVKADIIYEDKHVVSFFDPEPQAPIHFIVVPRKPIARLEDATDEDEALLGKLLLTAAKIAKKLECIGGYRVVINNGRNACQKVNYLHLHVFGGKQLGWPPC